LIQGTGGAMSILTQFNPRLQKLFNMKQLFINLNAKPYAGSMKFWIIFSSLAISKIPDSHVTTQHHQNILFQSVFDHSRTKEDADILLFFGVLEISKTRKWSPTWSHVPCDTSFRLYGMSTELPLWPLISNKVHQAATFLEFTELTMVVKSGAWKQQHTA
jgi:hypothetical protein